jgi:hypothetical protein
MLALGLTLLASGAARAQESYVIRLKGAGQGETTRYEDTLTAEMRTKQIDATGFVGADRREHSVRCTNYQETLLAIDAATHQATRLRRQCDKATLEVNGQGSVLPYHGRSFVVEHSASGCRVRFEGDAPSDAFVRELEEGFSRKKDVDPLAAILPGKAVQPGETWSFDPRPLLAAWPKPPGVRIDEAKAATVGKLGKVYRQGDRLFGVLEFRVEATVAGVEFGRRTATPEEGTHILLTITVDACIDGGASTFSLKMVDDLTVHLQMPGPGGQRIVGVIREEHIRHETRP